jgi:hypothetical protein
VPVKTHTQNARRFNGTNTTKPDFFPII